MIVKSEDVKIKVLDEKSSRKVIGSGDSLMMVEVTFQKDGVGTIHCHTDHEQISYIVRGSFEVTVGLDKQVLTAGDNFYAARNVNHGVVALEDDSVILDVFTPIRQDFLE